MPFPFDIILALVYHNLRHDENGVFELEYPQFLTLETGRMPDSIGQDAFSEVK